jgi:acyl carrier protein
MTRIDALDVLGSRLELGENLTGEEALADLPWDSITAIVFMNVADECFGVQVDGDQLLRCTTVNHLLELLNMAVTV